MENEIISLTAQIVSAHVTANDVSVSQLPGLIRDVHETLATIAQASVGQTKAEPIRAEPAEDPKNSVFADHILCLDCGQRFKTLERHLATDHGVTPEEYRAKWDLPPSYPMVTAEYAARRSKLALASGLGRKVEVAPLRKKLGRPKRK